MKKLTKKQEIVRDAQCYNRECFTPFEGKGVKICRFYEVGQCSIGPAITPAMREEGRSLIMRLLMGDKALYE